MSGRVFFFYSGLEVEADYMEYDDGLMIDNVVIYSPDGDNLTNDFSLEFVARVVDQAREEAMKL